MLAPSLLRPVRKATAFLVLSIGLAGGGAAWAGDCNQDIATLTQKRQGIIDQLNSLAKGSKTHQLDPASSCPKLKALAGAERQLVDYFTKNKEWCNVPDTAIENITASSQKTGAVATQACKIAEQMKKAQEQQATGGGLPQGQKLPTGPL
ncbi:hypothetical protein [Methylocella silvestris]|uniref:Uncharacterized protein n=1 Tax=Methylocella silvestris TaxID=199596 RepID=A0A2J7TIA1_METSI|nr:hypothetical protein [Methylocella silvestris]PNG26492.1 hypothetical protein CR492_08605 [Methylocella silvestris]